MEPTSEASSLSVPYDVAKVQSLTEGVTTENAKYRINVKFALFSGMDVSMLEKLEKGDESFNHLIRFLIMKAANKNQIFLSGGVFGLVNDLSDVTEDLLVGKAMYCWGLVVIAASMRVRSCTLICRSALTGSA